LLIDSGCAHTSVELAAFKRGKKLTHIANTHSHEDHIGGNGVLQDQGGLEGILAHPLALPVLADPCGVQPLQPYRRLFWGCPEPSVGKPLEDGDWIETENHRFQVIYTPGHSPDHICLYQPDHGWLFTGDLFVGGRDRALRAGYDIWGIIASLKRVAGLPVRMMFPGCARVREEPEGDLAGKIAYLEETGGKVLELYRKEMSPKAIARTLFGGTMWIEVVTLGHFTRRLLVESFLKESLS
jgi:glyoxylase-like metal-dependent hydrolase (beta-lactamase superfamily II)